MTGTPVISIVMPAYNADASIGAALQSIWAQDFRDFEAIVIDDGSTDGTRDLVGRCRDPRLRLICLDRNQGIIAALNLALGEARGEFIARFDADDVSDPQRLSTQLNILRKETRIGVIGSALTLVGENEQVVGQWNYPATEALSRWQMLFKTPVAHSAALSRRAVVAEAGGYSRDFPLAEDYELWSRVTRLAGIRSVQRPLVRYSIGAAGVSRQRYVEQRGMQVRIAAMNMEQLLQASVPDSAAHILSVDLDRVGETSIRLDDFCAAAELLTRLFGAFARSEADPLAPEVVADCRSRMISLVRLLPPSRRLAGMMLARRMAPTGTFGTGAQLRCLLPAR